MGHASIHRAFFVRPSGRLGRITGHFVKILGAWEACARAGGAHAGAAKALVDATGALGQGGDMDKNKAPRSFEHPRSPEGELEFIWRNKEGMWIVQGPPGHAGQKVTVVTRAGKRSQVMLEREVSPVEGGVVLYAKGYAPRSKKVETRRAPKVWRKGPGVRCRSVGCGNDVVDAPHHRAMEGYCGECAFDEFDC